MYIYGALDLGPTTLNRLAFGFQWSVSGWLLFPFLRKAGPEVSARLRQRVVAELTTTFASTYSLLLAFIATAFAQETPEAASQQWRTVADQMRPKLPKLAGLMDEAEPDVLAYMNFPREHRAKLYSTNPIERLNYGENPGFHLYYPGSPRTYGGTIGIKF